MATQNERPAPFARGLVRAAVSAGAWRRFPGLGPGPPSTGPGVCKEGFALCPVLSATAPTLGEFLISGCTSPFKILGDFFLVVHFHGLKL